MKAVVLAAGEGTRLRPRTDDRPKPLVEVAGKPILTHCFETLREIGITDAVVVVGYEKDRIIDRYGESFRDLQLEYAHQPERDGVAHAVLAAEPYVDSSFVVMNGDNIYAGNLSAVLEAHAATDVAITFPIDEVSREQARTGAVCELDDYGNITGLQEKPDEPPSRYAPAAFYVLPPEAFPACELIKPSDRGEYELPDAIHLLLYAGYEVETVPFDGWKININTEEDLNRAERRLREE
jgi:glucose-1-phosphate thymidylyltransferase